MIQLPLLSSEGDESDWRWQLRHAVRSLADLETHLVLSDEEREGVRRAETEGMPLSITPYILSLCSRTDPACPIRRQFVPQASEGQAVRGDLRDPLGEEAHEPVSHLVHRYPDRALLLVTDHCGVYCRFCTRSRMVGQGVGPLREGQVDAAISYLRAHPEISEVILSGGDALTMGTARLSQLMGRLRSVPSVLNLRLATRAPSTLPQRITPELIEALRPHHPIWIMTHFNHPKELTPASLAALGRLVDGGFPVMNQAVLLRGINDDSAVLAELFRGLLRARVRPYYLLQADPVAGTGHLRTSVATGLRIMEELQGRLSGIALPKYILDAPGGMGKVPLVPEYVVARGPGWVRVRTHRGVEVDYWDPEE